MSASLAPLLGAGPFAAEATATAMTNTPATAEAAMIVDL